MKISKLILNKTYLVERLQVEALQVNSGSAGCLHGLFEIKVILKSKSATKIRTKERELWCMNTWEVNALDIIDSVEISIPNKCEFDIPI